MIKDLKQLHCPPCRDTPCLFSIVISAQQQKQNLHSCETHKKDPHSSKKGCVELQAATLGDYSALFEMHIIAFLAELL